MNTQPEPGPLWKFQCWFCKVTIGPSVTKIIHYGLCHMCGDEGKVGPSPKDGDYEERAKTSCR